MKTLLVFILSILFVSCTVNKYYYPIVKCEHKCELKPSMQTTPYILNVPNKSTEFNALELQERAKIQTPAVTTGTMFVPKTTLPIHQSTLENIYYSNKLK